MKRISAAFLLATFGLRAGASVVVDWNADPVGQIRRAVSEPSAAPIPIPIPIPPPVETPKGPIHCRPEVIAAFGKAWELAGKGKQDYEAGFRIDLIEGRYVITFAPMTYKPLNLTIPIDRRRTVAIAHTHPDSAQPTPGDGDFTPVPNYVLSSKGLYVTVPGAKKRFKFLRVVWSKPC